MVVQASVLDISDISVRFGGLVALDGISFSLANTEICGLIGPNGAGKTTLVNVLTGFQRPSSGGLSLNGRDVTGWPPENLAWLGIGRTFQAVRLFRGFTVADNFRAYAMGAGLRRSQAEERVSSILEWLGLARFADQGADALSYGMERRVGIGRALMLSPKFLLLDEPAAGLNDAECDDVMTVIREIPGRFGCGVLLIEHNMRVVMNVCDRINVINFGRKIAEGPPDEIRGSQLVRDAYLGAEVA